MPRLWSEPHCRFTERPVPDALQNLAAKTKKADQAA
jgi:hypothetical protein